MLLGFFQWYRLLWDNLAELEIFTGDDVESMNYKSRVIFHYIDHVCLPVLRGGNYMIQFSIILVF